MKISALRIQKLGILAVLLSFMSSSFGAELPVRFDQRVGSQLPLNVPIIDEHGLSQPLSNYFGRKPVILSFVYYNCPNLCTLVLNALVDAVRSSGLRPGTDVQLMSISIDPHEKPSLSLAKKRNYLARLMETGDDSPAWNFFTAPQSSIKALTAASGFHFEFDPISHEYNHPSGVLVITPDGRISRYFFGIQFDPNQLKAAVNDASLGRSKKTLRQTILNCFQYNPQAAKYGRLAMILLRGASLLTLAALGMLVLRLNSKKVIHG